MNDSVLLAKDSGETLLEHTLTVIDAVRQIITNLPAGPYDLSIIEEQLTLCAALHDVGKAAQGFQGVLRRTIPNWGGKRHEVLSTAFAKYCTGLSEEAQLAILTHHRVLPVDGNSGKPQGAIPDNQLPASDTAIWHQMVEEWDSNRLAFKEFWRQVCESIDRRDLTFMSENDLNGLGLAPAWLKRSPSNSRGQIRSIPVERRIKASLYRGLLITADHMASGKTLPGPYPNLASAEVYRGELRAFQQVCRNQEGNAILHAPTGSGKTEASLFWMQRNWRKNGRVFYVLPYTASINAMHKRLTRIFGSQHVNVLHSKASAYLYGLLRDDSPSLVAQAKARSLASLAREMYFPIRVCTPHQIIRYALRGRGWEQMLAEFPQACFIFDEIHAYDAQMTGLVLGAAKLAMQWDARALFTTATMPRFLREMIQQVVGIPSSHVIEPDENASSDREILNKKRHNVEIWDGSLLSRLTDIATAVHQCPHTLIVCNHVRTAQTVFDYLQPIFGETAMLLHSRFTVRDRNRIEQNLLKELPRVLVATQVVEVSLDIDFHQTFIDPAPIDALVQRMGRVNRSGSRPPARVVVMGEQASTHQLYDKEHTQATIDALRAAPNPISEQELANIADMVYANGYQGDQLIMFERALHHPSLEKFGENLVAGVHQDWTDEVFDEADSRMDVLPSLYEKDYDNYLTQGEWLLASSLLVPLYAPMVRRMQKSLKDWRCVDDSHEPWVLHKPYDEVTGLHLDDLPHNVIDDQD
jgi:CRISPR-associated endonuclease/helicase Cas3